MSLKKACQLMGLEHLLLVQAANLTEIDCMGELVAGYKVCQKITPPNTPPLLRAFISPRKSEVICQMGSRALLTMYCETKGELQNCSRPQDYCERLKKIYARGLELQHIGPQTSLKKSLTCFFSRPLDVKLLSQSILPQ